MLAPRKKLWSTPKEAITEAIHLLNPGRDDVVFEIGFGEGEFLLQCARLTVEDTQTHSVQVAPPTPRVQRMVGVEIEQDRVDALQARLSSSVPLPQRVRLVCGNALEQDFSEGTVFFFYLIPRGVKIIAKLLMAINHPIRVASFMNPIPDVVPTRTVKVSSPAHPEAQWPLYYYEFDSRPVDTGKTFLAHSVPLHP